MAERRSKRVPQDERTALEKAQESKKIAYLEVKRGMKDPKNSVLSSTEIIEVANIVDVVISEEAVNSISDRDKDRSNMFNNGCQEPMCSSK